MESGKATIMLEYAVEEAYRHLDIPISRLVDRLYDADIPQSLIKRAIAQVVYKRMGGG